jgi:predicted transcriptional regulator
MRTENVQYFTEKEEEFANLLIEIGTKKNVAKVLVFLTNVPEATSRAIERGTDLRQPEVSLAIKYMTEQGWITIQGIPSERKGRPNKKYTLVVPVNKIIATIEKAKKAEANNQLALVRKIRDYI